MLEVGNEFLLPGCSRPRHPANSALLVEWWQQPWRDHSAVPRRSTMDLFLSQLCL
jgi:hypothetical protein